ncbi:hypothetical protein HPB47_011810 [Ixodes persulcatus]|uniref:Uncharacterized protein n=1 Tax=Ixodes persulcatus TaxID=34615 RepID=A0AC60NVB3_IXOPE|nr:hypothetical protein HPB47_011810 [Ixodes persulcatus]
MSRESTALVAAFAHALQSMQRETPPPKTFIRIPVPEYSGHSDRAMSATDFLLAIQRYRKATGLTEKETLGRVLPVTLVGPAARWHRLVGESAGTLDEFTALFRQEFLPADYLPRMRRELEERTQAPAEPFAEYLRAMQELLQIAYPNDTNQEQVERVVRQAHPTFSRYLRGRPFGSLSELAQEARRVQADILAERRYYLPPAPTNTLEPRCAWHRPVPWGYRRGEAAMAAASGEPSGNPWELTDDALEPGSRRGGSAAVHATEFRPTSAPQIAAAQEQAAADPLPQRAGGASLDVRDATQDAGVQCSVTLDFQPRIAPGGLSQLGHNRSPSSVHLSGGGGQSHGGQAGCSRTPFPRRPTPSRSRHSLL